MLTKKCIVCGNEYKKPYNCGLPEWSRRKFCSVKCKDKVGHPAWNKGKKLSEEHKNKLRGKRPNAKIWNRGICCSDEMKSRISEKLMGRPTGRTGEKCNFWRGGTTRDYYKLRNSIEWKNWRRAVFKRDNYTCQKCGAKNYKGLGRTIVIHAHHIKASKHFPELIYEISNGQTLCTDCHRQTDNYGCKVFSSKLT